MSLNQALVPLNTTQFNVANDGSATFTFTGDGGRTFKIDTYQFGTRFAVSGNTTLDNRIELFLGTAGNATAPELSLRHNGNAMGAIIQARNGGDTDGIFLDFTDSTAPWVRWGNAGPYLVKENTGIAVFRNPATVAEAQRIRIANTYTVGGVREYLTLGVESANRFCVRAAGVGGGSQRPLDLDGSEVQLQTAGSQRWRVESGTGHFWPAANSTYDLGSSSLGIRDLYVARDHYTAGGSQAVFRSASAITSGAGVSTGTLTNAPAAGNPTKWIPINDNGTTRYIPAW